MPVTVSIQAGMPCAWVRNCMWPPTTAWMIRLLPSVLGQTFFHLERLIFILSRIGSHGVWLSVLLPIHTPSIRTASLSLAIQICSGSGDRSSGFSFHVWATERLCALEPIGMISVLSMLNLAPDVRHQRSRVSCTISRRSFLLR